MTYSENSVKIQEVECRKKMQPNKAGDLIYIKANYDEDETVMIAYDWKNKRQISHVNGTPAAEFIFDDEDECFVYD